MDLADLKKKNRFHADWNHWGKICKGNKLSSFKFFPLISLLVLLPSFVASAKPAWLNFDQHRGTTYSYYNGSKKRQNWWSRFTISIANNNYNTKGHRVLKTKNQNKNWLATWYHSRSALVKCAILKN